MHNQKWMELLRLDNGVVEIRQLPPRKSLFLRSASDVSRFMSELEVQTDSECLSSATKSDARDSTGNSRNQLASIPNQTELAGVNLYTSLNRPNLGFLDHPERPLRDADIDWITRLPFDFDPVRVTGSISSDVELGLACDQRDRLVSDLRALGWPMPAFGLSGNGAHAVFRTWLSNTPELKEQLSLIYRYFADIYSTERIRFDQVVRNAGRIWRLYGSVNRKGDATADSPHRRASVVLPTRYERVNHHFIDRLAVKASKEIGSNPHAINVLPRSQGLDMGCECDFKTLDIVELFKSMGFYIEPLVAYKRNAHAAVCPWSNQHSSSAKGDCVIYSPDGGWAGFKCKHAHCSSKGIVEVVNHFGPDVVERYCSADYRLKRSSSQFKW